MAIPENTTGSFLIENASVIPDPLGHTLLTDQCVAIEGGVITAIDATENLRARYPEARRIDGRGRLLLPGLVDGHTHLYAALSSGMPGAGESPRNFPQVLQRVWWRWDKALRNQDSYQSGLIGAAASLHSGITTFFDHHASPHAVLDSLSHVAAGIERVGLRACLAYEVSDRDGEASRDAGIAENKRFVAAARKRPDNLIRGLFGLHAVFSCSDETLQRCSDEGRDLGVGFHLHVLEHKPEMRRFARTHKERVPAFLAGLGILGPDSIAAHTVQVDQDDILALKRSGTFNVHNPRSNMGNGVGVSPLPDMLAAGQPVGLGSDGFYDLPQEMVIAKLLQTLRHRNPSAFSDQSVLEMVYGNNVAFAQRIFGCQLGRIAPNYAADVILVSYDPPTPITEATLSGHIVAALSSGGVRTAWVNGQLVLHEGALTRIDESAESAKARALTHEIWKRL